MDYRYVNICGTTEEELKSYFKEGISELASANGDSESETIDKLRMRYGGYHFEKNSEGIYNPFSVLNTLAKHRYKTTGLRQAHQHSSLNFLRSMDIGSPTSVRSKYRLM